MATALANCNRLEIVGIDALAGRQAISLVVRLAFYLFSHILHCLVQLLRTHDFVGVKGFTPLVPGNFPCDFFRDTRVKHVSNGGAAEVLYEKTPVNFPSVRQRLHAAKAETDASSSPSLPQIFYAKHGIGAVLASVTPLFEFGDQFS